MKRDLGKPLASTYGDDPKDRTLILGKMKNEPKSSSKLRANPFLTDAEAKSQRAGLAKDLRTGKIDAATYKAQMKMSRTANDVKNVESNAGGSGVKSKRGGSCTPAETRSRSCNKPGKGF
jgi:hypothetical protein